MTSTSASSTASAGTKALGSAPDEQHEVGKPVGATGDILAAVAEGASIFTDETACEDSTFWSLYGVYPCAWFAKHDPGCTKYEEQGQRTHCQKTCGTCTPDQEARPVQVVQDGRRGDSRESGADDPEDKPFEALKELA
mmetsp:Transcript_20108/g.43839  ORF Transcript_20108/g.43839 Transcript_20108/m.43839 type:complete len:138 (-) Transcript_20108:77-490(-)